MSDSRTTSQKVEDKNGYHLRRWMEENIVFQKRTGDSFGGSGSAAHDGRAGRGPSGRDCY